MASFVIALKVTRDTEVSFLIERRLVSASCRCQEIASPSRGVGGEDQFVVVFQRVGDGLDVLLAVIGDFPDHVESVVGIDRSALGRQVADMAVGGQHGVVGAQILVDCLGLGRGLDDDNGHEHS
jgi:hypothetical protein